MEQNSHKLNVADIILIHFKFVSNDNPQELRVV